MEIWEGKMEGIKKKKIPMARQGLEPYYPTASMACVARQWAAVHVGMFL